MTKETEDIVIEVKQVYGKDTFYPVSAKAKLFAAISNNKTLSQDTLEKIAKLGYEIAVVFNGVYIPFIPVVRD